MAVSPQLQAAIAAHRFGLGEPDLGDRRPRRRRLARGADRPGRCSARQRAARHARRTPARRRRAREARAGAQSAARPDRRAGGGRPLPRDPDRRCPLAPRHRRGDARGRSPSGCTGSGPITSPSRSSRARPAAWSARSSATRSGRTSPAASRPCWSPPPPIRRCCATSTTGCRPGRIRGSSRSRHGAQRGASEGARVSGINENLAREVLELHTLGAEGARNGAYTQADVTAFAAVLTGWRVARDPVADGSRFDRNWHEPGRKTVLGKSYPEGPEALHAGAPRPRPPSGDGPLRRHQAGPPLRRRRTATGAGRPAGRGLPEERRPARRPLSRADPPRGGVEHAAGQAEDARGIRRLDGAPARRRRAHVRAARRSMPPAPCSRSASG